MPSGDSVSNQRLDGRSRMKREFHVRFCEGAGGQFPRATRLVLLFEREAEARQTWKAVGRRLRDFGLRLHEDKTRFIDCHLDAVDTCSSGLAPRRITGFNFLGFHFEMVPRHEDPTLGRAKVTTSESTITKSVLGWSRKADRVLAKVKDPTRKLPRLLDYIQTSVGGFLAYQDHLSDNAGLLRYLEAIRPVLINALRKAKANHAHLHWLDHLLAPENIPALIQEARRRGRWHKEQNVNWRTRRAGNPRARVDAGGSTGANPPPEGTSGLS